MLPRQAGIHDFIRLVTVLVVGIEKNVWGPDARATRLDDFSFHGIQNNISGIAQSFLWFSIFPVIGLVPVAQETTGTSLSFSLILPRGCSPEPGGKGSHIIVTGVIYIL